MCVVISPVKKRKSRFWELQLGIKCDSICKDMKALLGEPQWGATTCDKIWLESIKLRQHSGEMQVLVLYQPLLFWWVFSHNTTFGFKLMLPTWWLGRKYQDGNYGFICLSWNAEIMMLLKLIWLFTFFSILLDKLYAHKLHPHFLMQILVHHAVETFCDACGEIHPPCLCLLYMKLTNVSSMDYLCSKTSFCV